jgi:hypothetical protein
MTPKQARLVRALLEVLDELKELSAPPTGTRAFLNLNTGVIMSAATVTVDTVNAKATVTFVDDKGDVDAAAPAGTVATFTSDNPAVLTVTPDAANPYAADLGIVAEGVSNVGVTLADANGNPLLEADGTTPWTAIDPVAVTVNPGAAVGAQLSVA